MDELLGLTLGVFVVTTLVGHGLIRWITRSVKTYDTRVWLVAAVRGLFYTPAIIGAGHGVAIAPPIVGLILMLTGVGGVISISLFPALVVFGLSLFLSHRRRTPAEADE